MADPAAGETASEEIAAEIARFSAQALAVAKAFVAGDDVAAMDPTADELRGQLPDVAARMSEADEAYRAGLNRSLSEARLDLDYVLSGGSLPTSMRLAHVIREAASGAGPVSDPS